MKRMTLFPGGSFFAIFWLVLWSGSAGAQVHGSDLSALSLEDLMNVEISISGKKPQKINDTAGSVFVITAEDLRRSGATSIAEALRMVPGMHIARIDSSRWAITSRGLNSMFADKLLVLIDGRSVYTPLFSGVYWDIQDVVLEDIDRIEVIRGPGATVWGANAVNGVINVITKHSADTTGMLLSVGGGSEDLGIASARYGGRVSDNSTFRVFAKGTKRDDSKLVGGESSYDEWETARGGFRGDWSDGGDNRISLEGEIYRGSEQLKVHFPDLTMADLDGVVQKRTDLSGGHVLGRWERTLSERSDFTVQAYFDVADRSDIISQPIKTGDLDFYHRYAFTQRNELVWGLGYRRVSDNLGQILDFVDFEPSSRSTDLFSGFLQDEIELVDDTLWLTAGSKFEHNDFTGFEVQPGARLLWKIDDKNSSWLSFSRALTTPSRADDNLRLDASAVPLPDGSTGLGVIFGDPSRESTEMLAFEGGYRYEPDERMSFDAGIFANVYDGLLTLERGTPFISADSSRPWVIIPINLDDLGTGVVYGLEVLADIKVYESWRLQAWYSYLGLSFNRRSGSVDSTFEDQDREDAHNQAHLRSLVDLTDSIEFDSSLRFVDSVPAYQIPAYIELDLRLGWKVNKNLELSVVGQNLLHNAHREYISTFVNLEPAEIQRAVFGKITWRN